MRGVFLWLAICKRSLAYCCAVLWESRSAASWTQWCFSDGYSCVIMRLFEVTTWCSHSLVFMQAFLGSAWHEQWLCGSVMPLGITAAGGWQWGGEKPFKHMGALAAGSFPALPALCRDAQEEVSGVCMDALHSPYTVWLQCLSHSFPPLPLSAGKISQLCYPRRLLALLPVAQTSFTSVASTY